MQEGSFLGSDIIIKVQVLNQVKSNLSSDHLSQVMSVQRGLDDETISIRDQDKIFQPCTIVTLTLVCSFMFACQNAPIAK